MSAQRQKQCWSKRHLKHFKSGVSLQLPFYQWDPLPSPARCPQNLLDIVCDGQWCWVARGWPLAWRWPPKLHYKDCLSPFTSLSPSERPTGLLELGFPVGIGSLGHVTLSSLMVVLSSLVVKHLSQAGTFWNRTFRPPVDFWVTHIVLCPRHREWLLALFSKFKQIKLFSYFPSESFMKQAAPSCHQSQWFWTRDVWMRLTWEAFEQIRFLGTLPWGPGGLLVFAKHSKVVAIPTCISWETTCLGQSFYLSVPYLYYLLSHFLLLL